MGMFHYRKPIGICEESRIANSGIFFFRSEPAAVEHAGQPGFRRGELQVCPDLDFRILAGAYSRLVCFLAGNQLEKDQETLNSSEFLKIVSVDQFGLILRIGS